MSFPALHDAGRHSFPALHDAVRHVLLGLQVKLALTLCVLALVSYTGFIWVCACVYVCVYVCVHVHVCVCVFRVVGLELHTI